MNKSVVAITELKQQYDQCDILCSVNLGWKATTGSLISKYTGQESEFYQEYLVWRNTTLPYFDEDNIAARRQEAKVKFLIGHTIQHIERNGLYSPPKTRMFRKLTDWQTILAIFTIVGVIFSAGYKTGEVFEGKFVTKEQIRIEAELDSFRRQSNPLSVLRDSSSNKSKGKSLRQDTEEVNKDSIHK